MQLPLETILRRLVLLGIPLASPLLPGCAGPTPVADAKMSEEVGDAAIPSDLDLGPFDSGLLFADAPADAPDPDAEVASPDLSFVWRDGGQDGDPDGRINCEGADASRFDRPPGGPPPGPAPLCQGPWGVYSTPLCYGASSQPGNDWRLIDPDDPEQVRLYQLCAEQADCQTLCDLLFRSYLCDPAIGALSCGPACSPETQAGLHLTAWPPSSCAGGRRPAGLVEDPGPTGGNEAGAFFARVARLEAASVPAFRRLAAEVRAHGGPAPLVRRARRAMAEETRHFSITARLAASQGARPRLPRVRAMPLRSLEEVAAENAVEGCVHETYAALVALHQARTARDRRVRAAMASIAADELGHADLSFAVDAWCRTRLSAAARRRIDQRRAEARERLIASVASESNSPALARRIGLPDAERGLTMARALRPASAARRRLQPAA